MENAARTIRPLRNGARRAPPDDRANILLVDDRADKCMAMETILADLGQNIVMARSGKEALRCLLEQDFAVILLDVNMPGLDGFETAHLIRQRKSLEHTPIIFVTGISDTETHVSRGYSLGAVDYILTPVLPDVLRTKVSVFVELFKKNQQLKRQAESLRLAHDELEIRVQNRTFNWLWPIESLRKEIAERQRAEDNYPLYQRRPGAAGFGTHRRTGRGQPGTGSVHLFGRARFAGPVAQHPELHSTSAGGMDLKLPPEAPSISSASPPADKYMAQLISGLLNFPSLENRA